MTEPEWTELGRYIRWCADDLGLRDWAFQLLRDLPDDSEACASVRTVGGRKLARVRVCCDFREMKADEQRHTVIHELLHCHLFAVGSVMIDDVSQAVPAPAFDVLHSVHTRHLEYAVDGIADAIAKHFPLIDWPATGGKNDKAKSKARR